MLLFVLFAVPVVTLAMRSSSYEMQDDVVDSSGALSSSTSYRMQDSVAQTASGMASSTSYNINAGFQQNNLASTTVSISAPTPIILDPLSLTLDSAVGSGILTVETDSPAGYSLTVNASGAPAMTATNGSYFTDYGTTPTTWSVSNAYKFGFSVYGTDVHGYGSTSGDCTSGIANVPQTTLLWRGFSGTTTIEIASSSVPTAPGGTNTTMCIADAQNGVLAPADNYSASVAITVTAL